MNLSKSITDDLQRFRVLRKQNLRNSEDMKSIVLRVYGDGSRVTMRELASALGVTSSWVGYIIKNYQESK